MAKYSKGILGPVSGKVGALVFSSWNGINYVKRRPKKSRKPASEKQLIQRRKFGIAMGFLTPLRSVLMQHKREINLKAIYLRNTAGQIITEAILGENFDLHIDYAKVCLMQGPLHMPQAVMSYQPVGNKISLCWEEYGAAHHSNPFDRLVVLIYCPASSRSWFMLCPEAVRIDEYATMELPQHCKGLAAHLWLAFYCPQAGCSSSLYMGNVSELKTYDHENKS